MSEKVLWRKWRGQKDIKMMTEKMPRDDEKAEAKLKTIRAKVEEYWERQAEEEMFIKLSTLYL